MPAARRLEQFGIESPKEFPEARYVEQRVRGAEPTESADTPVVRNVAGGQSKADA